MSTFSDIPESVFLQILSYFQEPECRKLRLVSHSWDSTFRSYIGLRLKITNSNWQILQYEMSRNLTFSKLIFSDVTTPLGYEIGYSSNVNLTSLSFHRIVAPCNIAWSLNLFKSLKTLSFTNIFLEKSPTAYASLPTRTTLPSLEKLLICSKTGQSDDTRSDHFLQGYDKVAKFPEDESFVIDLLSKITYGKLSSVHLLCSEKVLCSQSFQQLFDSCTKYADMSGLTKLLYKNRFSLKEFVAGPSQNYIVLAWRLKPGEVIWKRQMQLLRCDTYLNIPIEWNVMFQGQSDLQFIRLNRAYYHWTAIQVGLKYSVKSLKEVHIAGGGQGSTADLSGFNPCSKLTCLEIILDDCHLENIHLLPTSLTELSLTGPLTTEDLQTISTQLENLESFHLDSNLPSTKHTFYGNKVIIPGVLTENLMKSFLSLPKIHSLIFRDCRIEVAFVIAFLDDIEGIDTTLYQVKGYPWNTHGSLSLQIASRKYGVRQRRSTNIDRTRGYGVIEEIDEHNAY